MHKILTLTAAVLLLVSCGNSDGAEMTVKPVSPAEAAQVIITGSDSKFATVKFDGVKLGTILADKSNDVKARYIARHPAETLEFFGITPGMTVGEALPGGGWYTKILTPYLGKEGKLVGIDYTVDMWSEFGFANEAFIETKKKWPEEFVTKSAEWNPQEGAKIAATTFGSAPDKMAGQLDAVLYIRALHNLSRFENEGAYLTQALKHSHALLKAGGIVGVVQHRAPNGWADSAATGSAGYLKQANVITRFDAAGFDLMKTSEINANSKDQPVEGDVVWRLPPSLNGVGDDADLKAKLMAIGETDRMTLLFKKR